VDCASTIAAILIMPFLAATVFMELQPILHWLLRDAA
jgi:hypothetical protein